MDNHVTRSINENTATKPILIIVLVLSDCLGELAIRDVFYYFPFLQRLRLQTALRAIAACGRVHNIRSLGSDLGSLCYSSYPFIQGFRIHTDKIWPFDRLIGFVLVHFLMFVQEVIGAIADALMTFLYKPSIFGRYTDNLRYFNDLVCLAECLAEWLADSLMGCFCDLLHAKRPCTQNSPGAWRS